MMTLHLFKKIELRFFFIIFVFVSEKIVTFLLELKIDIVEIL